MINGVINIKLMEKRIEELERSKNKASDEEKMKIDKEIDDLKKMINSMKFMA
ncbi:MAG: hypothetical protein K5894_13525 [Lachnospiraceae bacterium]|nr:hypothetical protein [Lachnospiraceae bacterium]